MGHIQRICLLAGVAALVTLAVPAFALAAGTYSWSLPGDFSGTAGTNPEHKYFEPSWSYEAGSPSTSLSSLPYDSSLAGWGSSSQYIAEDGSGDLVMEPGSNSVTIEWSDPFSSSETVDVSTSVHLNGVGCMDTASLTDQSGNHLLSGTGSADPTLPAGGALYLTVTAGEVLSCSADVTFNVSVAGTAPTISLTSPTSGAVFTNGQPIYSGTAGSVFGDEGQVTVDVFQGSTVSGTLVQTNTGTTGGEYTIVPTKPLANGTYTAIAYQSDLVGDYGYSSPVTFTVSNTAPKTTGLSLVLPAAGSSVPRSDVVFSGSAATGQGAASSVTIYLYRGVTTKKLYGKRKVDIGNASWSFVWPHKVKDGLYTARVQQVENGSTVRTSAHTFLVVPGRTTIGSYVSLSNAGLVTVPITCIGSGGGSCSGTVLVVTTRSFRTTSGGPSGPVRLLYTYVQMSSGETEIVRASVPGSIAHMLQRVKHLKVKVTTVLSFAGGPQATFTGDRTLTPKS